MTINKLLVLCSVLFFVATSCVFTVSETEKAIKFKVGRIVKYDYKPGLYFKMPLINNVKKFDSRIQTLDSKPERFLTSEKKNVIVDSFVKWRIGDVKKFYTVVSGNVSKANFRLDQIIKDAYRAEFSKRNIQQLVSTDRGIIRKILIASSKKIAANLGLEIIDVQVKRIDLPSEVSSSVYRRMEAERERKARNFRSKGSEEAERTRAKADRQTTVTLANAFRDAEKLRGEGDGKAAEIYANAYGLDVEFFSFYRSLNAYKKTFSNKGDMIVTEPNSDFFKYFKKQR
ncbi:MAG: protease modulator HflC [Methylococcales bacterium]|nr:protease modulator HflC [Methylococcales bacterium]